LLYAFDEFFLVAVAERKLAVQHCVKHHSDCPNVYGGSGFCCHFLEALGCHVEQRACINLVASDSCDSEVHDFDEEVVLEVLVLE